MYEFQNYKTANTECKSDDESFFCIGDDDFEALYHKNEIKYFPKTSKFSNKKSRKEKSIIQSRMSDIEKRIFEFSFPECVR